VAWEVEGTDEFADWYSGLDLAQQKAVAAAVEALEQEGPKLGRPLVDRIHSSFHHHMKELRPTGTDIRILFTFDPRRTAILLLGGNKAGEWNAWYERMIPLAEALYEEYLQTLRREGVLE
jgi:hypothetical protein